MRKFTSPYICQTNKKQIMAQITNFTKAGRIFFNNETGFRCKVTHIGRGILGNRYIHIEYKDTTKTFYREDEFDNLFTEIVK